MSYITSLSQQEQHILLTALQQYSKRAYTNATRTISGYGKASEIQKRKNWMYLHEDTEKLISKLAEDCT